MLSTKGRAVLWLCCLGVALAMGGAVAPALAGGGPGPTGVIFTGPYVYGVTTLEPEMGPWPGAKTINPEIKATFVGTYVPGEGDAVAVKFQAFLPTTSGFNFYQMTLEGLNLYLGSVAINLNEKKVQGLPILEDGNLYVKEFDSLSWDGNLPKATVHTTLGYGYVP